MTLHFTVYGVAAPKGSTRAFLPRGARYPVVTADNPKTKSWQQLVAEGASVELNHHPWRAPLDAAMRVEIAFFLPRPKRYQRPNVSPPHLVKPDLDKLVRAVKDALTGVAWHDDSQVVDLVAIKRYAASDAPPRAEIWIEPVAGVAPLERAQPLFAGFRPTTVA